MDSLRDQNMGMTHDQFINVLYIVGGCQVIALVMAIWLVFAKDHSLKVTILCIWIVTNIPLAWFSTGILLVIRLMVGVIIFSVAWKYAEWMYIPKKSKYILYWQLFLIYLGVLGYLFAYMNLIGIV